jgi:hypothetical protein
MLPKTKILQIHNFANFFYKEKLKNPESNTHVLLSGLCQNNFHVSCDANHLKNLKERL